MKAILINSKDKTVTHVEANGIKDWYRHIGCDCVETAFELPNGDACFVDEEGVVNGTPNFFQFDGERQPYAGNGIIIGTDSEGDSIDCKSSIKTIQSSVKFLTRSELYHSSLSSQ